MGILIPRQQIDRGNSENWAIALVGSGGAIISFAIFDLVNLTTRRGHLMWLVAGGLSVGVTTGGPLTAISYARFRTPRPLNHGDFDLAGGRLTTAGVGLGAGYSINYLTIWNDEVASMGNLVTSLPLHGSASMAIPGAGVYHGVFKIQYGNGSPLNPRAL